MDTKQVVLAQLDKLRALIERDGATTICLQWLASTLRNVIEAQESARLRQEARRQAQAGHVDLEMVGAVAGGMLAAPVLWLAVVVVFSCG